MVLILKGVSNVHSDSSTLCPSLVGDFDIVTTDPQHLTQCLT